MSRASGRELAFEPVQDRWVLLNIIDDIDPPALEDVLVAKDSVVQSYKWHDTRSVARQLQITFRRWQAQDLAQYKALLDHPDVWALLPEPYPNPVTNDLAASLIELSNETTRHDVCAVLADGVPVAQVRLIFEPGDPAREDAEISYWLGRDHWGCGIGAHMVAAYVEEVTARFPSIAMLIARIHRDNEASARIVRKAGFERTSVSERDPNIDVYRIRLRGKLAENADKMPPLAAQ